MHIAICDDDKQALNKYAALLESMAKKHDILITISRYGSGEALLFDMEDSNLRPQILYLDVNMPRANGIDVAQTLREMHLNLEIVFLTVSREHWSYAFDLDAANYVVKEMDESCRFERAFLKAVKRVQDKQAESILLTCAGQSRTVKIRDITYFEVKRNVMVVHYVQDGVKRKFEFYSTMARIEELVWGKSFVRIQRSFLVSLHSINLLRYASLTLSDGTELPVGRIYYKTVRETIDKAKVS